MISHRLSCPHCATGIHVEWDESRLGSDADWTLVDARWARCPACSRWIVEFGFWRSTGASLARMHAIIGYPKNPPPRDLNDAVPDPYRGDFLEACAVLPISSKAAAALTRRLLQHVLREQGGVTRRDLNAEIDAVIEEGQLPSGLAEDLDELRHLGNFATHPIKSTHSGEVVEVEPGEAEAGLDVLDDLLDFYFVRPAIRERRRDTLNAKLAEAGKPPLKEIRAPSSDADGS